MDWIRRKNVVEEDGTLDRVRRLNRVRRENDAKATLEGRKKQETI